MTEATLQGCKGIGAMEGAEQRGLSVLRNRGSTHTHADMHTCILVHTRTHARTYPPHVHTLTHTQTCVCVHTHTHLHTPRAHIHTRAHAHSHTHACVHMHTYTHTHTQIRVIFHLDKMGRDFSSPLLSRGLPRSRRLYISPNRNGHI